MRLSTSALAAAAMLLSQGGLSAGEKKYDPGATDTEIKIGQTMPYSGPASAYGTAGKAELAYWNMINSQGGINGRKVNLISLDDAYSPPKTVEQTRKLVEQDEVLAIIGSLGTPTNAAIQKYLNGKKIPHLMISSGASRWNDPKNSPWSMPFYPPYEQEGRIYGKYIAIKSPNAKIAVLYQNDDFGKDYLKGLKNGLGEKASQIVQEAKYEVTEPTVESQMATLRASGADTFVNITTSKFAAQAIRKIHDYGWTPTHYIVSVATSIPGALEPAGLDASTGLITAIAFKIVGDPAWDDDPGMKDYLAFLKATPDANPLDGAVEVGYTSAQLAAMILKNCGDDLTRENILKQATSLRQVALPMFLPGVTLTFTPDDYSGFDRFRMARFDGTKWVLFGDVMSTAEASH